MGILGPSTRMIAENLEISPSEATKNRATLILLGGSVLPFFWRPLGTSL